MPQLYLTHLLAAWLRRRRWLAGALALLLLAAPAARATHIVGGELDLQYQSGNTYQLSLTLYFDAVNGSPGALDNALTAGIFDKATNQRLGYVNLPLLTSSLVPYTSPACAVGQLVTRQLTYRTTLELLPAVYNAPQGYYVAVERCCRNVTIGNISNPGGAAQTFYLEFPPVVRNGRALRDSTPRIFPPLADYACLGELFTYDFGGQDADGDSLVYDLVTPLNGHANTATPKPDPLGAPYSLVSWLPGLGTLNQIPGSPALRVAARTGRLTVRPTQTGLFVFGVRCQEFRAGVKLGETRRDFQLMVLTCPTNAAPMVQLLPGSSGSTVYQPRDTLHLRPGSSRCLRLRFTDPDRSARLTLSVRDVDYGGQLPTLSTGTLTGTVHAAGQPDTLLATLCFPDCANTNGQVRHLDVIVADNGCALPKRDTVHVAFTATLPPDTPPTLRTTANPSTILTQVGGVVAFDVIATDAEGDPITITPTGGAATAVAGQGATFVLDAQVGTQRVGHFRWPIDCRAVSTPPGQAQLLGFTASSTAPCRAALAAPSSQVSVTVEYRNTPPQLTSTFPAATPAVVRVPLGQPYTATLAGTDADGHVLALSAAPSGFDLAAAGMSFSTTPRPAGQAAGTFTWLPRCDPSTVQNGQAQAMLVTFQLQEQTCRPVPQSLTVRFEVINPDTTQFTPPNIILPTGPNPNNRVFTMSSLPPDFCDSRFAEIRIFSRWGRQVYQSADRNFHWPGENVSGLYYYLLTYTTGRRYKGWVEVVQQ